MLKGICINATGTYNLELNKVYYLYEHGESAYYVSNFPNDKSHLGGYSKYRFKIINESNTTVEEPIHDDNSTPKIEIEHEQTTIFDFL